MRSFSSSSGKVAFVRLLLLAISAATAHEFAASCRTVPSRGEVVPASTRSRVHVHLPNLDFSQLARLAVDVVHGRVVGSEARILDNGLVVTDTSIRQLGSARNTERDVLVVTVGGGSLRAHSTSVAGAPAFELGDEVVLFLCGGDSEGCRYGVLGLSHGVYRVVDGPTGLNVVDLQVSRGATDLTSGVRSD